MLKTKLGHQQIPEMLRKQIRQVLMSHQMSREREGSGMAGLGALGQWCCNSGTGLDIS